MSPLSPRDLERRKPVWIALSNLWLDNEIDEVALEQIAQILKSTTFTKDELRDIYLYEVAPVVYQNLRSPAGEWTGFDPSWLCHEMEKQTRRRTWLHDQQNRLKRRSMTHATEPFWDQLMSMIFE